jgi:Winged helix-turn helix
VMQIVKMVGLSYPTVRNVIDLFVEGGWPALRPAGRELGQGRRLSDGQECSLKLSVHTAC